MWHREGLNDVTMDWLFLLKPPPRVHCSFLICICLRFWICVSLFVFEFVYRDSSSFTHNMRSHFGQVVDLDEHDNLEIKRAILPHTESKYERALRIYDQLVPICVNSTLIMIDT